MLVIEDGSKDATLDVAKACEASDPKRVRVLQHPGAVNLGVAATRNLGLEAARGEMIAFLDADDAWLPHKLQRQLDVLARQPETGFVFSDVLNAVDPDPMRAMAAQDPQPDPFRADMAERFNASPSAALELLCLHPEPYRFIPSPTPLVRRRLFQGGPRFVGKPALCLQYEDFLMWRVLAARTRVHCLQEPLAIYRMHGASFTGNFAARGTSALHLLALEQVQEIFLSECGKDVSEAIVAGMRTRQGERLVGDAHRLRWRDMGRMLLMARRYGVCRQLLVRRTRASMFHLRATLGAARRKFSQGADQ